jgi:hypothetical protein
LILLTWLEATMMANPRLRTRPQPCSHRSSVPPGDHTEDRSNSIEGAQESVELVDGADSGLRQIDPALVEHGNGVDVAFGLRRTGITLKRGPSSASATGRRPCALCRCPQNSAQAGELKASEAPRPCLYRRASPPSVILNVPNTAKCWRSLLRSCPLHLLVPGDRGAQLRGAR